MSDDVLFIHSAGAQSDDDGSGPLARHLREALGPGCRMASPRMPDPDHPSYARWRQRILPLLTGDDAPAVLVGHSLGGSVLLKLIAEDVPRVAASDLFLVASPFWGTDGWDVAEYLLPEGFASRLPATLRVHLYQSEDDEVVDISHLDRYAHALPQATARRLMHGGHVFRDGLPELAEAIQAALGAATGATR